MKRVRSVGSPNCQELIFTTFRLFIIDTTPPTIDWCNSPPTFLSTENEVDVYWEEPLFSDNSGKDVRVSELTSLSHFKQNFK